MTHLPARATTDVGALPVPSPAPRPASAVVLSSSEPGTGWQDEDGSLVAEYGLLAVVAATMTGVLIMWARGDALSSFFTQLLDHARSLVLGG